MIVACPACGKKNRVRPARLPDTGQCGACHAPIGAITTPLDADTAAFDAAMRQSELPVLVDFWAPWCGPCRRAAPEVASAARTLAGKALVLKVNTEAHPDIAQRFGIRGIPYFAVFKGGKRVAEQTGLVGAAQLCAMVG